MQISIVEFHKVQVYGKELDVPSWEHYFEENNTYYRDPSGLWYTVGDNGFLYALHGSNLSNRLEYLFSEMKPFKGQLELF